MRKKPFSLSRRIHTHWKHFEDNPVCCLVFFVTHISYLKCMYYIYLAKRYVLFTSNIIFYTKR